MPNSTKPILQEALDVVYGDRARDYGHPTVNFQRIADLWNGWALANKNGVGGYTVQDVGMMMLLVKVARLVETPLHRDSYVDLAGYAEATARAVGVDE